MKQVKSNSVVTRLGAARVVVTPAPEWDRLFRRYNGWTGADGIFSVALSGYDGPGGSPTGRTLLLFSDTLLGRVNRRTQRRSDCVMINTSLAMLKGNRPRPANIRFLVGPNGDGTSASVFSPDLPSLRGKRAWYWLQDGVCTGGNIYTFPMIVEPNAAGREGFQFKVSGVAMIKIPVTARGIDLAGHTQRETKLVFQAKGKPSCFFGAGILANTEEAGAPRPDGFIYIYGRLSDGGCGLAAARVRAEDIEDFAQWRFWNGRGWARSISAATSLGLGGPELSVTPITTGPLQGKYVLFSMLVERDIYMRVGDSPVGPFGPRINVYHTSEPDAGQSIYTYNAKAHPHLSASGELLVSYNVNTTVWKCHLANGDIYRPRFLKVRFEDC